MKYQQIKCDGPKCTKILDLRTHYDTWLHIQLYTNTYTFHDMNHTITETDQSYDFCGYPCLSDWSNTRIAEAR